MHYIYIIQYRSDSRIYVGQSINPRKRWSGHKTVARKYWLSGNINGVCYINRAMAKYGSYNFEFQIIEKWETQKEANEAEIFWIEFFQSCQNGIGFNITPGGKSVSGSDHPLYGVTGSDHPAYGQTPHNKLFTDEQEVGICNKYSNEKININKLSELYSCTPSGIFQILKRHNVKILGNAVFSKGKHHSPETEFKKGQTPHNKIFTKEQEDEICTKYTDEKLSTVEMGKTYNCSSSAISRLLCRNNIETRHAGYYAIGRTPPNKLFTEEQEKEICDKYINSKLSIIAVAKIYGCDKSVISDTLDKYNVQKRSWRKFTDCQKNEIREEYKIVKSSRKLAKKYNVSKTTILNIFA